MRIASLKVFYKDAQYSSLNTVGAFGIPMLGRPLFGSPMAFSFPIEIEIVYFYSPHMKLTGLDFRT